MAKSQKHGTIVHAEYTNVSQFLTIAGSKDFDVAPTTIRAVSQRDTITEFEYTPIRLPSV